jgi:membrane associated rhomboid family serine protease
MLEDRDYMRQPAYHEPRLSLTVLLIILNTACFVAEWIASFYPHSSLFLQDYLALSLDGLKHGYAWQFLTYQFMHAGWMHLFFNCLVIFFFGRSVETILGRSRFIGLYLTSGIIGGVVQMFFALAFQSFDAPVVGASAGASGLIAAFAYLNWREQFTVVIYFFPVTMRGRTLFWASVALAAFGLLLRDTGVAHAAHLGGILAGFLYARQVVNGGWPRWNFSVRQHGSAGRGSVRRGVSTKGSGSHPRQDFRARHPKPDRP